MVPFAPIKHNPYLILDPKVSQKCILGFFWTLNEGLAQYKSEPELFVVKILSGFQWGFSTDYGPFCPNKKDQ